MAAIRELLVQFGVKVDNKQLNAFDNKLNGVLGTLREFAGPAGLLLVGRALKNWTKDLLTTADALGKQADRLGIGVEELQIWQQAAGRAGASTEDINKVFRTLARTANEAADGTATYADAFKELEIEVENAETGALKALPDLLFEAGVALFEMEDATKRAALAQDVFGKSGLSILTIFKDGKEGAEDLLKAMRELGGGFTEDFVRQAEEVNDRMADFDFVMQGVKSELIISFLPAITETAVALSRLVGQFRKNVKGTDFFKRVLRVGLIGALAITAGGIAKLITRSGGLIKAFGKLSAVVFRVILPLLILEDLIVFLQGGTSVLGALLENAFGTEAVDRFRDSVNETIDVIKLGWEGLWAFIKLVTSDGSDEAQAEFLRATDGIEEAVENLLPNLLDIFVTGIKAIVGIAFGLFNLGAKSWAAVIIKAFELMAVGFMFAFFTPVANGFANLLGIITGVANGINAIVSGIGARVDATISNVRSLANLIPGVGGGGTTTVPGGGPTIANVDQRNDVTMTINAAPGQSATTVGRVAAQQVGTAIGVNTQAAAAGLVQ